MFRKKIDIFFYCKCYLAITYLMMYYLILVANIVTVLAVMVFETYSIYEYRTCSNYDNRPYYNDFVFSEILFVFEDSQFRI